MSKPITPRDRVAAESSPVVTPVSLPVRSSSDASAELEVARLRGLVELVGVALHLANPDRGTRTDRSSRTAPLLVDGENR